MRINFMAICVIVTANAVKMQNESLVAQPLPMPAALARPVAAALPCQPPAKKAVRKAAPGDYLPGTKGGDAILEAADKAASLIK